MKWLIFTIGLCVSVSIYATGDRQPAGARQVGMGFTGIALPDLFSAHNNQAALDFLDRSAIGLYSESRFIGQGVGNYALNGALKTNGGTFGMDVGYFGYNLYNEIKAGVGYGKKLGSRFAIGLMLDYFRVFISEYGSASNITFETSIYYKVNDKFQAGAHLFNPLQVKLGEYEERLPSYLTIGTTYAPSDRVNISLEAMKDIDNPASIHGGLEFMATEKIYLRAGIATNPGLFTVGAGFDFNSFRLDFATSYHQYLGISPHAGLVYTINKNR